MEKTAISTHAALMSHILEVRASRDDQGRELKESFKKFAHALSPIEVAKSSIHELVKDKGVQFDLIKGGMNLGSNYLIESVFNRQNGIKGFLSSVVLEKLSSSFIQANAGSMIVGITNLFSRKTRESE